MPRVGESQPVGALLQYNAGITNNKDFKHGRQASSHGNVTWIPST